MLPSDLIVLGVVIALAGCGIVFLARVKRRRRAPSAPTTAPGGRLVFRRARRVYTMRRRGIARR